LQILSVSNCNLFDEHTLLDVTAAQELQVSYIGAHIGGRELHVHAEISSMTDLLVYASLPLCVSSLVDLRLHANSSMHSSSLLVDGLSNLLHHCQQLKISHLKNNYISI